MDIVSFVSSATHDRNDDLHARMVKKYDSSLFINNRVMIHRCGVSSFAAWKASTVFQANIFLCELNRCLPHSVLTILLVYVVVVHTHEGDVGS